MTTTPNGSTPARRLPTWARVLLSLVGAAAVGLLAVVGLLVWALSGGWDGLRPTASQQDRTVVKARSGATGDLDAATSKALQAVGSGAPVARARVDECREGQNNWKIHDGWTLRCELTDVVVLDVADPSVDVLAARVDPALSSAGWVRDRTSDHPAGDAPHQLERRYALDVGRSTTTLDLGAGDDGTEAFAGHLGLSSSRGRVGGDAAAVEAAVRGYSGTRAVVRTTVRYFEDS